MGRAESIRKLQATRWEIEPDQEIGVGAFRPEDAPGIAQAYLEAYGDAFPMDYVYDPAEIARRNATGELHTLVARTGKGDVVGFAGLFRPAPNPEVYEAGQLNVVRSYRKRHVATALQAELFSSLIPRLRMSALFTEALGNHTFSQQMIMADGLTPAGLEVECLPPAQGAVRRLSLFLMTRAFRKSACPAHLPDAYRAFCEAVYAEQGLPRAIAPGAAALSGETLVDRFALPDAGLLRLTIRRCGADIAEAVAAAEVQAGELGVAQLYLDLGDAATPLAVDALRSRGYFFAGLLPCWFGTDGLLLQKVPQRPDWEAIKACGPEAEAVRCMVREDFEHVWRSGKS